MGPSPHYEHNARLHIPGAVHDHARDLASGRTFASRQILKYAHARSRNVFAFTPFEIAPTHVYTGNRRFHSLAKEVIREGGGKEVKGR
jgi:hypothetical protein